MKKSPLKAAPLHNPGQSLDEEIQRVLDDKAAPYTLVMVSTIALALLEWWRWYTNLLPSPSSPSIFLQATNSEDDLFDSLDNFMTIGIGVVLR